MKVRIENMAKKKRRKSGRYIKEFPMSEELYQAMLEQKQMFIEKFGREPGPEDPLFFEPDSDVPEAISDETLNRMMNEVFNDAGIDPVITYAYHKTGLLVSEENIDFLSEEDIAEWNQAIEEAKELFKKNKA
jgi:hypothetical protein